VATKNIQQGGQGGEKPESEKLPKLRKMKPTDKLKVSASSDRDIYAGLGPQGDIVAVNRHPLKAMHGDVGAVLVREGQRVIAVASHGYGHAYCARLTLIYLMDKTGIMNRSMDDIEGEYVRLNVCLDGSDRKFVLDRPLGHESAQDAVKLLTDLGVKKQDITYDPTDFK
jgi:hypothetical protein